MKNTMPINPKKAGPATPAQASGPCQTSHSPLPWTLEPATMRWTASVIDKNGDSVVWTSDVPNEGIRNPANAAFIVRACNEYDAFAQVRLNERHNAQRLADALELAFDALDTPELRHARASQKHVTAYKAAREALAQYNESSADADALESLDQLEQLEGGE